MTEYGMFPVSVIIAGFCVMSLAYLICFCCCIIQFFVRRNRALGSAMNSPSVEAGVVKQKNDKLKNHFCRQYLNSLKRFNKNRCPDQVLADSSCVGFCPICFEEYKGDPADNFVGLIKTCGHFFHFSCIWEWLENHQTCPLCRGAAKLRETDIKGLSLRHVDAYKECALAQEKTGGMVKTVPSEGVVEAGVEAGGEAGVEAGVEAGGSEGPGVLPGGSESSNVHGPPPEAALEAALEATEDRDSERDSGHDSGRNSGVSSGASAVGVTEDPTVVSTSSIVVAVDIEDSDLSRRGQTTTTTTMDTDAESSCQVAVLTPGEDSRQHIMSHDNPAFVVDETT